MLTRKCPPVALAVVQIIAHRGASHDAPENTLAAVRLAWVQDADAVEVDVHLTRDGRLAVIHDPDTRRTGGAALVVADATLAELQRLDVGRWKDARFAGEKIPALEDVFALVPDGKRIFVELKSGPESVPALARAVKNAREVQPVPLRAEQIVLIAFDLATAVAAKRALPAHEVCWIAEAGAAAPHPTVAEIARGAHAAGLDGIDLDAAWPLDVQSVQRVQQTRAGAFQVYVWTVDDAPHARRLASAGVNGLTTNRPGWLRAQLASA